MKMLSCKEAGKILKVHHSRIRQFIAEGRLPAMKISGVWIIPLENLDFVRDRKPGRPRKDSAKVIK